MLDRQGHFSTTLDAERYLPACMSLIAGIVDVTSWLTLGGLFAAHITGNIVVVAATLVEGRHPHAAQTLAVPVFVLAVIVASLIARRVGDISHSSSLHLLWLQTFLLSATFLISVLRLHGVAEDRGATLVQAMLAVSAMATQNALLHLTRDKVPTTAVMTGNLVVATIAVLDKLRLSTRLSGEANWKSTWPLLVCFFLGCIVGAGLVRLAAQWAWLVPAALSLLYVLWFYASRTLLEPATDKLPA